MEPSSLISQEKRISKNPRIAGAEQVFTAPRSVIEFTLLLY
jgi:hypothetical protein